MLMYKDYDILHALSSALSKRSETSSTKSPCACTCTQETEPCTQQRGPSEKQVIAVASYLNDKMHDQIKRVNK